jgi:hypothetical protein
MSPESIASIKTDEESLQTMLLSHQSQPQQGKQVEEDQSTGQSALLSVAATGDSSLPGVSRIEPESTLNPSSTPSLPDDTVGGHKSRLGSLGTSLSTAFHKLARRKKN